jgi:hypothetical protein
LVSTGDGGMADQLQPAEARSTRTVQCCLILSDCGRLRPGCATISSSFSSSMRPTHPGRAQTNTRGSSNTTGTRVRPLPSHGIESSDVAKRQTGNKSFVGGSVTDRVEGSSPDVLPVFSASGGVRIGQDY